MKKALQSTHITNMSAQSFITLEAFASLNSKWFLQNYTDSPETLIHEEIQHNVQPRQFSGTARYCRNGRRRCLDYQTTDFAAVQLYFCYRGALGDWRHENQLELPAVEPPPFSTTCVAHFLRVHDNVLEFWEHKLSFVWNCIWAVGSTTDWCQDGLEEAGPGYYVDISSGLLVVGVLWGV